MVHYDTGGSSGSPKVTVGPRREVKCPLFPGAESEPAVGKRSCVVSRLAAWVAWPCPPPPFSRGLNMGWCTVDRVACESPRDKEAASQGLWVAEPLGTLGLVHLRVMSMEALTGQLLQDVYPHFCPSASYSQPLHICTYAT